MIEIECPVCGARFEVRDSLKGGAVNCRSCSEVLDVPGSSVMDQLFYAGLGLSGLAVLAGGTSLIVLGAVFEGIAVLVLGGLVAGVMYAAM